MANLNILKVQKILRSKKFAHLATIGPDGVPQSSPMWFLWDGEYIKFTHTTTRQKYQNIQRDPMENISNSRIRLPDRNIRIFSGIRVSLCLSLIWIIPIPMPSFAVWWSGLKKTQQVPSMIPWRNTMVYPGAIVAIRV